MLDNPPIPPVRHPHAYVNIQHTYEIYYRSQKWVEMNGFHTCNDNKNKVKPRKIFQQYYSIFILF